MRKVGVKNRISLSMQVMNRKLLSLIFATKKPILSAHPTLTL
jgi:hypothetical protein